mgnify:CR=1 FL=1
MGYAGAAMYDWFVVNQVKNVSKTKDGINHPCTMPVEVMERIFGTDSTYSERTQNILKQVMLISEENNTEISIYGKTGMGKAEGIVVDAWFTGFAETLEGNKYFCVYLGQSDAGNTSSTAAKEIAIQILNDNK